MRSKLSSFITGFSLILAAFVGAACDSPESTCECVVANESECFYDVSEKPTNQCLDLYRDTRSDYYHGDDYGAQSFKADCATVCPAVCGSTEFSEKYASACGGG